jgi:hypothetical protein
LQCRCTNLVVCGWWLIVMQCLDIATHRQSSLAVIFPCVACQFFARTRCASRGIRPGRRNVIMTKVRLGAVLYRVGAERRTLFGPPKLGAISWFRNGRRQSTRHEGRGAVNKVRKAPS